MKGWCLPECLESIFDHAGHVTAVEERVIVMCVFIYKCIFRIASGNNTNKSESDQEDNDDVNDNDWSYGAEKKGESVIYHLSLQYCRYYRISLHK